MQEPSRSLWLDLIDMLWSECSRTFSLGAYKWNLCTASKVLSWAIIELSNCVHCMCWPWWTLHWCQEWDLLVMSTRTCATVRMEEQIALLIQKLDEQCQQIKCLGESQSTQLKEMEWRLYQMENRVNSLMEELETLQQKMWLKQKQDSETDTLAQPQTFSGYSGQFQQPMPPQYPVVYLQVAIWSSH